MVDLTTERSFSYFRKIQYIPVGVPLALVAFFTEKKVIISKAVV